MIFTPAIYFTAENARRPTGHIDFYARVIELSSASFIFATILARETTAMSHTGTSRQSSSHELRSAAHCLAVTQLHWSSSPRAYSDCNLDHNRYFCGATAKPIVPGHSQYQYAILGSTPHTPHKISSKCCLLCAHICRFTIPVAGCFKCSLRAKCSRYSVAKSIDLIMLCHWLDKVCRLNAC